MKRIALVFAITSSLLFGSLAFAAVKAGATCSKAGSTSTVSGKKYTCIKSGKKLVWDKGVVVKKSILVVPSAPKSETTPTSAPESTGPKSGDTCTELGSKNVTSNETLLCLNVAGNRKIWINNNPNNEDLTDQNFDKDFNSCRIPDSRVNKIQREAIAFPVSPDDPNFSSVSTITIAIVPIDFPDEKGETNPKVLYDKVIQETNDWNSWYSRGKSKVNWIIYPEWIRAPKNSSDYSWTHPKSMTAQVQDNSIEVGQALIDLAETKIDMKGVQDILFIYPPNITKIEDSINYQRPMKTKYGYQFLGVYATSLWSYKWQSSLAMWLIHENMHRFGYAGHSPGWPMLFSIANNQGGESHVMNIWDRMVLDWLNPGDLFCTEISNINGQEIKLVPQEREQIGPQGIAIKLSSHELLIIESHKPDKWSQDYKAELYGLTLMYVDTTRDTDRSGENFGDDYKGIKYSRTATYVDMSTLNHPDLIDWRVPEVNNYLMYQGESFTFKGVKVEFLETGFNDKVRISRTS